MLLALALAASARIYVSNEASGDVSVIENDAEVGRIRVGTRPRGIRYRDGKVLFVSNEDAKLLSVVDIAVAKVTAQVPVGGEPEGVKVSPDGKLVFVTSEEDGEIDIVDAAGWKRLPDGRRLYSANGPSNDVSIIDVDSGKVIGRIAAGGSPWGVAVSR